MTDTHDVLVDAAEQLVRSDGLDALSMRALATRTNYGKSTVHEALGSTQSLVAELRVRAMREMFGAAVGDMEPDPESISWRRGMYRRVGQWMRENPHWAEVALRPDGDGNRWVGSAQQLLLGTMPVGMDELPPVESSALAQFASRTLGAVVPLATAVDDPDYVAESVEAAFETISAHIVQLMGLRGLDTAAVNPVTTAN